jgi:hypothetical protein
LGATLIDGITPWSLRMIPRTDTMNAFGTLDSPRMEAINSFGNGARTFTIELLVESTLNWTKKEVFASFRYVQLDGTSRTLDTLDLDGAPLETSTAPWSKTTLSEGGVINYVKRKITITTPTPVLGGSSISATLKIGAPVANITQGIFFDPDIQVS